MSDLLKIVFGLSMLILGIGGGSMVAYRGIVQGMIRGRLRFAKGGHNEGIGARIDGLVLAIVGLAVAAGCFAALIMSLLRLLEEA